MSLFDNEKFTIYRDVELEAFYEVDLTNRRKIILAHVIIYFFPVLMAILISRVYSLDSFALWLIAFSLMLYVIVIVETISYLYPKSRKIYKKYFLRIIIPIGILIGVGGYYVGMNLTDYTREHDIDFGATFLRIMAGGAGVIALFGFAQFGLSRILLASKELYTRKAKAEADIQFATEIQERILQEVTIENYEVRAYACSNPANELGGDFFELSLRDDQLFASIGDISGHSFGAGLLMTLSKSALQTHLEYNHDPAEVMSALNTTLNRQTNRAMYATMTLLKLNIPKRRVTLCNAGHLPVLHIPTETGEIHHRHEKGLGLGITGAAHYKNLEFDAENGDLLILYSDGLVEIRDENKQMRDAGYFEELVTETIQSGNDSPRELAAELLKKVRDSDHSPEMEDDSSLIVIEV
jgi:hypothetical protein